MKSELQEEKNTALHLLEEKAAENDNQAKWLLAQGWSTGEFGETNLFLAKKWLLEMKRPGPEQAANLLNSLGERMQRNEFSLRELQKEASRCDRIWLQNPVSSFTIPEKLILAIMHIECGTGLKNISTGVAILEELADKKNPIACYLLGKLFAEGNEVREDLPLSASYLREACTGNVEEACSLMADQKKIHGKNYDQPHVGRSVKEIREQLEMLAR